MTSPLPAGLGYKLGEGPEAHLAVGVSMSSRIGFSPAAIRIGHSSRITYRATAIRVVMASRVHLASGPDRVDKVRDAAEIGCPSAQSESQRQKNSPDHRTHPFLGWLPPGSSNDPGVTKSTPLAQCARLPDS